MRISSRGTVSGGPIFWLLAMPFIAVGMVIYVLFRAVVLICTAIADHHRAAIRRA
jgi:hypothetical protein